MKPVTEEVFQRIEREVLNAEVVDDSEELIEAYFEDVPWLIAEVRRLWKLLDDNGIPR